MNPSPPLPRPTLAGGEAGAGEGRLRLRRALDLAEAEEWEAAAAELSAARSLAAELPVSPSLAAALFLLAGRRHEAVAGLAAAQRRDPADPRIAHVLLLSCYHTLRHSGEGGPLVERAIASWAALLHQDRYWTSWLAGRLRCYGESPGQPAAWRDEVLAELRSRLEELGAQGGDPAGFRALLQREVAAAEQLAAVGGFAWPGRGVEPLVCGPLMIQALDCPAAFGAFLAALPVGEETAAERVQRLLQRWLDESRPRTERRCLTVEEHQRLRRSFSRLGLAQALLDLDRPAEAWAALAELACPQCRSAASAGAGSPVVCAASCPGFDRDHPGYAGWPDKAQRLERDALELAVDVQLALGHAAMTAAESDPAAAARSFREALRLAAAAGQREGAERRVVATVLGRVKALAEKGSLAAAIALVEPCREACLAAGEGPQPGAAGRESTACEQLTGCLAELLTRRGVEAGNEGRWETSVDDLRRAVALNPHAVMPLWALTAALQRSARQSRRSSPARAVALALEAVRLLAAKLPQLGGQPEAEERLDQARKSARDLVLQRANALAGAGGFDQSLDVLEQGLAVLASDSALVRCHRDVVLRYSRYLNDKGQSERVLALLRRAR